jgi:GT2 family glycosyltransferase
MNTKLAVVILNWNGRHFLERFLPSVVKNSDLPGVDVYVADNASSDDSVEWLQKNYSETVKLLQFDENYGFAGGYNKVFEELDAEYICLLNSDVEVAEGWIQPILSYLESHTDTPLACSKLKDEARRDYFEYASAGGGFIDRYGYPFCRGRIFETLEKDMGQYDTVEHVLWGAGAALFVKRDIWIELGGLDASFFAHMEEIDLCWRANAAGYKMIVHPESVVYHVGGGTLPKNNARKTFLNFRNNLWMLKKNLNGYVRFRALFMRFLLDGLASFLFLVLGRLKDFGAVYKAWWWFVFKSKHISQARKLMKKSGNGLPTAGYYSGSILFDYYVRRNRKFSELKASRFKTK